MIGKILKNAELIENSHCRPGSNDQQNHSSHLVRFADVFSEPYILPKECSYHYQLSLLLLAFFLLQIQNFRQEQEQEQ